MRLTSVCIEKPVAAVLVSILIVVTGLLAFFLLPIAPLPEVEFPTIVVRAVLPGADPQTMAKAVAAPLEKRLTAIAGLQEMSSVSLTGYVSIVLRYDLDRDINGAARDVQAAIDAARADLPSDMPQPPSYYKSNPADAPIALLSLTSDTLGAEQLFNAASSIVEQRLSRIQGIGNVGLGGGALPAVRVVVDEKRVRNAALSFEKVRRFILSSSPARAMGLIDVGSHQVALSGNDNLLHAEAYANLYLPSAHGAVRLGDIADVKDSLEDIHNAGLANGQRAVLLLLYKQPGANVLDAVQGVKDALPFLRASVPAGMTISMIGDRTPGIRAALRDMQIALLTSIAMVVAVTLFFFRAWRSAIVPGLLVPISLAVTFGAMYLLGFSLNILSLMAMAISTGFVIDDAIVVVENIERRVSAGGPRIAAILQGASEVSSTVVAITVSMLAAFVPLLFMGGIIGRFFREFAITLAIAVIASMCLSLTVAPALCRIFLRPAAHEHGLANRRSRLTDLYSASLLWTLKRPWMMAACTALLSVGAIAAFALFPKALVPRQDTGRLGGALYLSQESSFVDVQAKLHEVVGKLMREPDVKNIVAYAGTDLVQNEATVFMYLKAHEERADSMDQVIARLQQSAASIPGVHLYLQPSQDIVFGGRRSPNQYQYTITADDAKDIGVWGPAVMRAIGSISGVRHVTSDTENGGRATEVHVNRVLAAAYGLTMNDIDQALYDAFGQRRLSILYAPMNQFRVVVESSRAHASLRELDADFPVAPDAPSLPSHATGAAGAVPVSALASREFKRSPLLINHTGQQASETISFDIDAQASLETVMRTIEEKTQMLLAGSHVHGRFNGEADVLQSSMKTEPLLIAIALVAVYVILGILYESLLHPITILTSIPPACVGMLIALAALNLNLDAIAVIGLVLLIGVVKKNGIMLVDFALRVQRDRQCAALEAIHHASLNRLRPIVMTTVTSMVGAVPLLVGTGYGAELRKPLGVTIIGGLLVSQLITLYSTPAIYLLLERGRARASRVAEAV